MIDVPGTPVASRATEPKWRRWESNPRPSPATESACHVWKGARNSKGYGVRTVDSKRWLAHRYAYVQAYGPMPPGAQLHHLCHNRLCINPDHLKPVSATEHRRSHMNAPSSTQIVEEALRNCALASRQMLIAIGATHGVSQSAIVGALARTPGIKRVSRGWYRLERTT